MSRKNIFIVKLLIHIILIVSMITGAFIVFLSMEPSDSSDKSKVLSVLVLIALLVILAITCGILENIVTKHFKD